MIIDYFLIWTGEILVEGLLSRKVYEYIVTGNPAPVETSGRCQTAWLEEAPQREGWIGGLTLPIADKADHLRRESYGFDIMAEAIQNPPERRGLSSRCIIEVEEGIWYGWDPEVSLALTLAVTLILTF